MIALAKLHPHLARFVDQPDGSGWATDEQLAAEGVRLNPPAGDFKPLPPPPATVTLLSNKNPATGPGSELKRLLAAAGIHESADCECADRARVMDTNGAEWCAEHISEIVDWLAAEALKTGRPFIRLTGHLLVWAAILSSRVKAWGGKKNRPEINP